MFASSSNCALPSRSPLPSDSTCERSSALSPQWFRSSSNTACPLPSPSTSRLPLTPPRQSEQLRTLTGPQPPSASTSQRESRLCIPWLVQHHGLQRRLGLDITYSEGLFSVHRPPLLRRGNIAPCNEFGFGPSYTTFKHYGLLIIKVKDDSDQDKSLEANWEAGKPSPQVVGASTALWLHRPVFSVFFTVKITGSVAGTEIRRSTCTSPRAQQSVSSPSQLHSRAMTCRAGTSSPSRGYPCCCAPNHGPRTLCTALQGFFRISDTRAAAIETENVRLRARLDITEGILTVMRHELQAIKGALGP